MLSIDGEIQRLYILDGVLDDDNFGGDDRSCSCELHSSFIFRRRTYGNANVVCCDIWACRAKNNSDVVGGRGP